MNFIKNMYKNKTEYIKQILMFLLIFSVLLCFFYRFSRYGSNDYKAHYEFALNLKLLKEISLSEFIKTVKYPHIISYPGWHICYLIIEIIVEKSNDFFGMSFSLEAIYNISVAILNSVCVCITLLIINRVFTYYLKGEKWINIFSMFFLFIGPLYIPGFLQGYYMGSKTGNIWHNPTYLIVKPLAIYIFFVYVSLLENTSLSERERNKELVKASIFLVLSAVLKPSFYQMFLPALFLWCVVELIRSRGKKLKILIKIGFSVVPVTILGLVQMQLSLGQENQGIGIAPFRVWSLWTGNMWILALILSIAFPMAVFIFTRNKIKGNVMSELALFCLLSGCGQYIMFFIKQSPEAGDFGWGFSLSVALLFLVAFIQQKKQSLNGKQQKICKGLFFAHLICGFLYFMNIFMFLDYRLPLTIGK